VREQAIDDQSVDSDYGGWGENDVDEQPGHWDTLLMGERVVEAVVFERERLVEGRDLVDDGENSNEYTIFALVRLVVLESGRVLACFMQRLLHYDEVVDDVSALVSLCEALPYPGLRTRR
jgi:hypothetical protein